MGRQIVLRYKDFLSQCDDKLEKYFDEYKEFILCKRGCCSCCEKGDYPLSQLELEYLMQGYIGLDDSIKMAVQSNLKNMKKGETCPFLINKECSIYPYRPVVCRVHGLAYLCKNKVKVPYCTTESKNFSQIYSNGEITIKPIDENLDTTSVLKEFNYGEIRNLFDWVHQVK